MKILGKMLMLFYYTPLIFIPTYIFHQNHGMNKNVYIKYLP